jgi:hypothetical protein
MTTSTEGPARTPEDKLRVIFTRQLDGMQDRHALTYPNESGRGIASAIISAWRWLDKPDATLESTKRSVQVAYETARNEHAASAGTGHEDFFAYARADGLSGVLGWIRDIEGR